MEGKPTVSQKPYRGRKIPIATLLVVMEDFKAELKLLFVSVFCLSPSSLLNDKHAGTNVAHWYTIQCLFVYAIKRWEFSSNGHFLASFVFPMAVAANMIRRPVYVRVENSGITGISHHKARMPVPKFAWTFSILLLTAHSVGKEYNHLGCCQEERNLGTR